MLRSRRGNFAIIIGISLTALLGMGALAIDSSYAFFVRQQAINAADAAALAGSLAIDGTDDGLELAADRAIAMANANLAAGHEVELSGEDIEFGVWDDETRTLIPSDDAEEIDAIAVRARIETQSLMGEAAFGHSIESVSGRAVALAAEARADTVDCFLPIAIPSCLIEGAGGPEAAQDIDMVLNPPGADNVGWARPDGNPNASWLKDQIRDCEYAGEVEIGDTVDLGNGVVASAMKELATAIEDSDTSWDGETWGAMPPQEGKSAVSGAMYGNTWEAPALVFDDDSYCGGGGRWNGSATLSGFVGVSVYDVVTKGKAEEKTIKVRVDTTRTHKVGKGSGGPSWGVSAAGGGRLVR